MGAELPDLPLVGKITAYLQDEAPAPATAAPDAAVSVAPSAPESQP